MKQIIIPLLVSIVLVSCVFVAFEQLESYFSTLLETTKTHQSSYALVSFLILAADIILPVPSSIVMYLNGVVLGVFQGALLSLAAGIVSCMVGYLLGNIAAKGLNQKPNETTQLLVQRYGSFAIIITRGIPILSESICFTLGYNKVDFKNYVGLNIIGYLPICLLYAYFGNIAQTANLFLWSFAISIGLSALLWFLGKRLLMQMSLSVR